MLLLHSRKNSIYKESRSLLNLSLPNRDTNREIMESRADDYIFEIPHEFRNSYFAMSKLDKKLTLREHSVTKIA